MGSLGTCVKMTSFIASTNFARNKYNILQTGCCYQIKVEKIPSSRNSYAFKKDATETKSSGKLLTKNSIEIISYRVLIKLAWKIAVDYNPSFHLQMSSSKFISLSLALCSFQSNIIFNNSNRKCHSAFWFPQKS
jgi:hypothetical protein